jgi:hypothetical protein
MKSIFFLILALLAAPLAVNAKNKAIYGDDNRKDYFEVSAERQAQADSVVSLWDTSKVSRNERGGYLLMGRPFGDKIFNRDGAKLCESEPFRDQPIGAECSGTLVGEDLVMTAGHCIPDQAACEDMKVVFDYNVKTRGGKAPSMVPDSAVYSCKSIVSSRLEPGDPAAGSPSYDYAIIRLDRKAAGRKPLPIDRKGGLAEGSPIYSIGHPVGLPAKIADNAAVIDIRRGDTYFMANLDTYGGNSGSGVFSAETGLLVGILVRGRNDFHKTPEGCFASEVFEQNPKDGGENVTKIGVVAGFIPGPAAKARIQPVPVAVDSGNLKMEGPVSISWGK